MDDWQDDAESHGEIRAVSARVLYDGSLAVTLIVPGEPEPVETVIAGDEHTVMVVFGSEAASRPIDLQGTPALDRRCQRLVARGVARLNDELARRRRRQRREQQRMEGISR